MKAREVRSGSRSSTAETRYWVSPICTQLAQFDLQAAQQVAVDHRAPDAVLSGKGTAKIAGRRQLDGAVERIEIVDGLQFDQHPARVRVETAGHGAHFRGDGDIGALAEPGLLFRAGRHMGEAQVHVAAQQDAPVALQALQHRFRNRADAGNGGDAEGEAGEEDAESLEAAAQLPPRQPQGQRQAAAEAGLCIALRLRRRRLVQRRHEPAIWAVS